MSGKADLVWARALDQSVREVARLRGLGTAGLSVEQECEVSAALAAAVIALADQADRAAVDVVELELVARTELAALDRFRRARHRKH
jgi:hypothetical protein